MLLRVVFVCFLAIFSSCNVFEPFDSPSGDVQLLSAARACLDQGDLECARRYYAQLSPEAADDMHSELAFLTLEENGAGLQSILIAIGAGNVSGGRLITLLANQVAEGATLGRRNAVFGAFRRAELIHQKNLRGLVRFLGSASLLAQLLAETRLNGGTPFFDPEDVVNNPEACISGGIAGCAGAACTAKIATGTDITEPFQAASFEGDVSLFMIRALVNQMSIALNTEIDAGGKFASGALTFAEQLQNPLYRPDLSPSCFSFLMVSNGLGAQ